MKVNVIIENREGKVIPAVKEGINLITERKGMPGKLIFSALGDDLLNICEGDRVSLYVDELELFRGKIFSYRPDGDGFFDITAYDKLRYLTNRDTYIYENKRASDVVKMVFGDLGFELGEIAETQFVIPVRIEENRPLWNVVENALELEHDNTGNTFVLYDDAGKIMLKKDSDMMVDIMICDESAESLDYMVSIDNNTYNVVKTVYADKKTGSYLSYVSEDEENKEKWGKLQYYDSLMEDEDGQTKSQQLLALLNRPTKTLTVSDCFGHVAVRGGSMLFVNLMVGKTKISQFMRVEFCSHSFFQNDHKMSLRLSGGEYGE